MKGRVLDIILFYGVYLNTALLGIFNEPNLGINAMHQEPAVNDIVSDIDENVIDELPFDESDVHFTVKSFLVDLVSWIADGKCINDFHGRNISFTIRNDNNSPVVNTTHFIQERFIRECQEQYGDVRGDLKVLCEKITNITVKNKDLIDEDFEEITEILHGIHDFIDEWQDFEDGCRIVNIATLLLSKSSTGKSLMNVILEKGPSSKELWNSFMGLLDQIKESASDNENMDAVHLLEKIFTASVEGKPIWFFFRTHVDCKKMLSSFTDSLRDLLRYFRGWMPFPGDKFSQVLACWERMGMLKVSDAHGKVVYFCYKPDLIYLEQNIRPGVLHYSDWLVNAGVKAYHWDVSDYPNIEAWERDRGASDYQYKGEDKFNGKEFFHYMWWCGKLRNVYQAYVAIKRGNEGLRESSVSAEFLDGLSGLIRHGFISVGALKHFLLDKTNSGESVWSKISKEPNEKTSKAIDDVLHAIVESRNIDFCEGTTGRSLLNQLLSPSLEAFLCKNYPATLSKVWNIIDKKDDGVRVSTVFGEIHWTRKDLSFFDD